MLVATAATIDQVSQQLCGQRFHASAIPMWVFEQKTLAFLLVNQAAVKGYGFSLSRFLSMTILDIRPSEEIQRLLRETISPHQHKSKAEVWMHMRRDGAAFPVEIVGYELMYEGREAELIMASPVRQK